MIMVHPLSCLYEVSFSVGEGHGNQGSGFRPSHLTSHDLGNPGLCSLHPSHPAHISATVVSSPPLPEITSQPVRLPVVAVVEVCVLRHRHEDSVDCIVGASQSYGAHRHHRIVPTPCLLPVPVFLYPVEGAAHILLCEQSAVWQHSQATQRHRVVAGELVNTHWVVGLQSPFCKERHSFRHSIDTIL